MELRSPNCDGSPCMPRTVVTPFATYRNSRFLMSSSLMRGFGRCPCISVSPGIR